jgi:hypothetical protein
MWSGGVIDTHDGHDLINVVLLIHAFKHDNYRVGGV